MQKITIEIDKSVIKEIESCYGKTDETTVRDAVENILDRYLHAEYLELE